MNDVDRFGSMLLRSQRHSPLEVDDGTAVAGNMREEGLNREGKTPPRNEQ